MAKLAITGGSGFLGYHIANQLKDKYKEIKIIDVETPDMNEYPKNVSFFKADIREHSKIVNILKDIDEVVHGAAALPLRKPKEIFSVNVNGTRSIFDAALKNKVKKLVLISSTAVYGVPKIHPLYEDSKLVGVGPYGKSKIATEKLAAEFRKKGLFITTIRPKTFIGTARLGVFQILFDWVENGVPIPILGNGKNRYQLLEVTDLVNAIYLALKSKNK